MYRNFTKRWLVPFAPCWILLLLPVALQLPDLLGLLSSDPILFTAAVGDSGRLAGGYPWIDPNVGFQAHALGKLSADLWLSGQIPWWNSYSGVGLPLAAEAQPGSLFLPFVLLLHFRSGGVWVEILMQVIAGLSTYALLRKLKLSKLAALTGAILFQFNGTFAWHSAPIVTPVAFLPMLVLGIESLRERIEAGIEGGWWLIPPALAWSIYAGFPETAYIDGLFAGAWVLARLSNFEHKKKLLFLGKLTGTVIVGILLALPLIIPFAEYLTLAFVGGHQEAFAHAALPLAAAPLSLMPWLYGPIFLYDDPAHAVSATWGNIGGYLTAMQCAVVAFGFFFINRKFYFVLLSWMLICLAKTFDISPVTELINLLPLIKSAAFFRYSPPSWQFAAAVIVAFAVHGIQHKPPISKLWVYLTFAVTALIAFIAVWLNRTTIEAIWGLPGYPRFFKFASLWLLISLLGGATALLRRGHWRYAVHGLAALLIVDACIAFAMPIRSGAQDHREQDEGIKYLQQHLGLQRVYTLGPLSPNYGAFFKVAEVNHNYLPIARSWIDYVRKYLNPQADPIIFLGDIGRTDHSTDAATLLREHQAAYEELAIKYVIAPSSTNPFDVESPSDAGSMSGQLTPFPLDGRHSIAVRWRIAPNSANEISGLSVLIGNYNNKADGWLDAKICADDGACVEGERAIVESIDNQPFTLRFKHSLPTPVTNGAPIWLTATLSQRAATQAVALWLQKTDQSQQMEISGAPTPGLAPVMKLKFIDNRVQPALAYTGPAMTIYELRQSKPYYEIIQGTCQIRPNSRTALLANCATPSRLLRREAFYPGWFATIDGTRNVIERHGEIFQSISVPAGLHIVKFHYAPSYSSLILLGWLIGAILLLLSILGEWRGRRRYQRRA